METVDINDYKPCREGTHKVFISSENRCTHIGNNPNGHSIRQYKVDGEVFPKGTAQQRCDYLLLNDTGKKSYYIELKGSDIFKAAKQIDNTVSLIGPSLKGYTIFRRIVYKSGTHNVKDSSVTKWQLKHRDYVRIERNSMNDTIS